MSVRALRGADLLWEYSDQNDSCADDATPSRRTTDKLFSICIRMERRERMHLHSMRAVP